MDAKQAEMAAMQAQATGTMIKISFRFLFSETFFTKFVDTIQYC